MQCVSLRLFVRPSCAGGASTSVYTLKIPNTRSRSFGHIKIGDDRNGYVALLMRLLKPYPGKENRMNEMLRERARDRQTDRETDSRQTDRQTETHRETETDRHR